MDKDRPSIAELEQAIGEGRDVQIAPDGEVSVGETAAYWRGRYEGMIEALRKTHSDEQLAEMGIVL